MYDILLIDIDNTLLDFDKAEDKAIRISLEHFNIDAKDEIVKKFKDINKRLWKEFELGNISKERLLEKRFEDLFFHLNMDLNRGTQINKFYLNQLSLTSDLMPNAYEVLSKLINKTKIYAITNGVYETQMRRINNSLLKDFFSKIYISEKIGIQKPQKGFFDFVFHDLNLDEKDKHRILLVGDSLTADIIGGIDYNIDTCWYNNKKETKSVPVTPTYQINDLEELLGIM